MWQLIDIAYVIPATVGLAFFIGKYLEANYEGNYLVSSILIGASIGLILSIYKIKCYVDSSSQKLKKILEEKNKSENKNSSDKI